MNASYPDSSYLKGGFKARENPWWKFW